MAQRPRLPVMAIPGAPLPVNQPMVPGMRPPVLPRPIPGAPGEIHISIFRVLASMGFQSLVNKHIPSRIDVATCDGELDETFACLFCFH